MPGLCAESKDTQASPSIEADSSREWTATRAHGGAKKGATTEHPASHDLATTRSNMQLYQVPISELYENEGITEARSSMSD